MANRFVLNEMSYHGHGAIENIAPEAKAAGFKKALVCSDPDLLKFHVTDKVVKLLDEAKIPYEIYSNIKPNPTIENVTSGVEACKKLWCEFTLLLKVRFSLFQLRLVLLLRLRSTTSSRM